MDRQNAPDTARWDLTAIYADSAAVEADIAAARDEIALFSACRDRFTADADRFLSALEQLVRIRRRLSKLQEYTMMNADLDLSDNGALSLRARVDDLADEWEAASGFFTPTVVKLPEKTLTAWRQQQPLLAAYDRLLFGIRRYRPYTLSDEGEQLLADTAAVYGTHEDIRGVFCHADLRFGKIRDEDGRLTELTGANFVPFLMSGDRRVRRAAFTKMYETYEQFGNTFAALLQAFVKERVTVARVRGYESSLQASVFDDEVTPRIYENLIQTVGENLTVLYDYYDLKREQLGVSTFHLYDVYAPMTAAGHRRFSYDEAVKLVLDTVSVFGEEYRDTLEKGLSEHRWADVYPGKGKRDGAYSAGGADVPPYMLLNFTDTFDDVCTLAHEAGHSMHTWYATHSNPPQDSGYTIFVAEVASTVNELLLVHRLLRETDDPTEKKALLDSLLEIYKGTLFRQTMFAEYERDIHRLCAEGEPLTCDRLCETYYALVKRYFGPRVVCDDAIKREWMRIPHFYYDFYVYKYATCLSAASAIVRRIETEGEAYVGKYLDFLRCGNSRSPLDSLRVAEIDLTDPSVVQAAIADFADAVKQFREWEG